MTQNFHSKLVSLFGNNKHFFVRNADNFNEKLNTIVEGTFHGLHVISDFDKTITKRYHEGQKHYTSFGMFSHCPSIPSTYIEKETELNEKYIPLENSIQISPGEKIKYMEEWWAKSEAILRGLKIPVSEISEVVSTLGSTLRDGTIDMFHFLNKMGVPLLVFSAGLGDIVECVLKDHGIFLPNIKVISNFLNYNEDGVILGFKHTPIQVFNKNEEILKYFNYDKLVSDRKNVMLMGDSLGDTTMSEGGHENVKCCLKIGFLDVQVEENLPKYMDAFDIVLVNDDTMDVPRAILNFLL